MKTLLSLLCTISFVLAQFVSTAAAVSLLPARATPCKCCNCHRTGCCASQDSLDRSSVPAVPPASAPHSDSQFVAVEISRFLAACAPALPQVPVASPDAPAVTAVPLFTRDCARLL